MRQQITKINMGILIFTFLLEIILFNIFLVTELGISIYNEGYNLVKAMVVMIGFDVIFVLYMLDYAKNGKKNPSILKLGKVDVNFKMVRSFFLLEIFKMTGLILSLQKSLKYYEDRYVMFFSIFLVVIVSYYLLYQIMPKRENLGKKIKKLCKEDPHLKIIIIDGDMLKSSFDIEKNTSYKVNNNHLYVRYQDLPKIHHEKFVKENVIAVIHEVKNVDQMILSYQKINFHKIGLYHIMAVKNNSIKEIPESIKRLNAVKVCSIDSAIEFTENLFITSEKENVSKLEHGIAKISVKLGVSYGKSLKDKDIKHLNTIYEYQFNHKLEEEIIFVPKQKLLFELYRNAYLHTSAYQSTLAMFHYITVMGKMVEYYLYAKYNKRFDVQKIDKDIIGDRPSVWTNQILLNIYQQTQDGLYKNIREKKFLLSPEEQILMQYLSSLLNMDILGNEITFNGLQEIFTLFRNKVEAHGIISDANVYAVWNLTKFFVNIFSRIFKIEELECVIDPRSKMVMIGYAKEAKVKVGQYIIKGKEDELYFVKNQGQYIDYMTGNMISKNEGNL